MRTEIFMEHGGKQPSPRVRDGNIKMGALDEDELMWDITFEEPYGEYHSPSQAQVTMSLARFTEMYKEMNFHLSKAYLTWMQSECPACQADLGEYEHLGVGPALDLTSAGCPSCGFHIMRESETRLEADYTFWKAIGTNQPQGE